MAGAGERKRMIESIEAIFALLCGVLSEAFGGDDFFFYFNGKW